MSVEIMRMARSSFKEIIWLCLLLLLASCSNQEEGAKGVIGAKGLDFTILDSATTGITFSNDLKETLYMNGLFYEYFYNGAGLATGDFNKDGLIDIYFISNLHENELYLNKGNLQFEEVGIIAGLTGRAKFPTGVTTVDINHDGRLDIYICASGKFRDPNMRRNELYINEGNNEDGVPVFKEQGATYGLDLPELSTQAAFFDMDRDNDLDMFLINHDVDIYGEDKIADYLNQEGVLSGERLYRNDNGKYTNVTSASGIINNRLSYGLGLGIGDINNDGWQDIYVSHDFSGEDHLYINNQDGTYKEEGNEALRQMSYFSMGNDIADFNNDGWLDILTVDMVSEDNYGIKTSMSGMNPSQFFNLVGLGLNYQYMFNALQMNRGIQNGNESVVFSEIGHLAGLPNTDWSWAPLFVDMDLDGDKDVFIANGVKRDFRNNDFINYHKEYRKELGKAKSIDEETYIKNVMGKMPDRNKPNYFFRNNGDLTFTKEIGPWSSIATSTNGASYADLDNDGDLDFILNNMDAPAQIYKNNAIEKRQGNFLKISFQGAGKNTLGIGARVKVIHAGEVQIYENQVTRGFQSAVNAEMNIGLGRKEVIERIEIFWPDGKFQKMENVIANQTLRIDYSKALDLQSDIYTHTKPFFKSKALLGDIANFSHKENEYDDFDRESLLPHRMSQVGPAMDVADFNGDGKEDIFVGGAMGQEGSIFLQNDNGQFTSYNQRIFSTDKKYEDTGALFFDADGDNDLDLYVVSGGNEKEAGADHYRDRMYKNENGQLQKVTNALPPLAISGKIVKAFDFDGDGDEDLFLGGRQSPGMYPNPVSSTILENISDKDKIAFIDVTEKIAPDLMKIGMVTDAQWADLYEDGSPELIICGEWMPIMVFEYREGKFVVVDTELKNEVGWWNSLSIHDYDNDGDKDIIAGNLGLNYKYNANAEEPFEIYANDFDSSGNIDIVLGYYNNGDLFPLRGRECSSNQMPFIKSKFPTYTEYGKATLKEVYDRDLLDAGIHYKASNFATSYYENEGNGSFKRHLLPNEAQLSSCNSILSYDFNKDGNLDLLLSGNLYVSEVETPRNDASYGTYLEGDGAGGFNPIPSVLSGLYLDGQIADAIFIDLSKNEKCVLFATNNEKLQLLSFKK